MIFPVSYINRLNDIRRPNIVRGYPLQDTTGDAFDSSLFGVDATVTSATQAGARGPDKAPCYLFNGTTDTVDCAASLNTDLGDWKDGSVIQWAQITDGGVWTDGTYRNSFHFWADTDNAVRIRKNTTSNQMQLSVQLSSTLYQKTIGVSDALWHCYALRWQDSDSGAQVEYYLDGVSQGTTVITSVWEASKPIVSARIGSHRNGSSDYYAGNIGPTFLWKVRMTTQEMIKMSKI
jgi:hypothetical protein